VQAVLQSDEASQELVAARREHDAQGGGSLLPAGGSTHSSLPSDTGSLFIGRGLGMVKEAGPVPGLTRPLAASTHRVLGSIMANNAEVQRLRRRERDRLG
jgi:hypothetical protein